MAMIAAGKSDLKFERIIKKINKIKNVSGRLEKIGKLKNNSISNFRLCSYPRCPKKLFTKYKRSIFK